jgi:hypothetical protein
LYQAKKSEGSVNQSKGYIILLLCIFVSIVDAQAEIHNQPHTAFVASTYEHQASGFAYGSAAHIQNHWSNAQSHFYTLDQHTSAYLLSNNNPTLTLSQGQEQLVLGLHHCYDNPQLLARIKALSEYPTYIKKLYALHQSARTRLGKAWNHFTGKVPKNINVLYREVVANEAAATHSQPSHISKHHNGRAEALSRAIASHHQLVTISYCISNATEQLLESCQQSNDALRTCTGDAYQQHIHQELIDTLDQTGMLYIQHRDNLLIHDLTMILGECSYNGIIANQQHEVVLATTISDFCSALSGPTHTFERCDLD